MGAFFQQQIIDCELLGFCATPGRHPFAADPILELPLALGHQHAHPVACQNPRERRAAQSAAGDNHVEVSHFRTPEPESSQHIDCSRKRK